MILVKGQGPIINFIQFRIHDKASGLKPTTNTFYPPYPSLKAGVIKTYDCFGDNSNVNHNTTGVDLIAKYITTSSIKRFTVLYMRSQ